MKIDEKLIEEIHSSDSLESVFGNIEEGLLFLLCAGSFTVYKKINNR